MVDEADVTKKAYIILDIVASHYQIVALDADSSD